MLDEACLEYDAGSPGVINLRGTGIDVAHVLELHRLGRPVEFIAGRAFAYPVDEAVVRGALAYAEANRAAMDAYLAGWDAAGAASEAAARAKPPSDVERRIQAIHRAIELGRES